MEDDWLLHVLQGSIIQTEDWLEQVMYTFIFLLEDLQTNKKDLR